MYNFVLTVQFYSDDLATFESVCDHIFCSLALVLPKYSEHFIQAKLGDDIKQAMCKYDIYSDDNQHANKSLPPCILSLGSSLDCPHLLCTACS